MLFVGIDNGVTGTITILTEGGGVLFHGPTPTKRELSYTKKKQHITRVDGIKLVEILHEPAGGKSLCILERPFTGGQMMFKAVVSGMRALEATLICIESLNLPYRYIDSKEWQKALLPSGLAKGETKRAALDIARRLFPQVKTKDADSLLIAEFARRNWQ